MQRSESQSQVRKEVARLIRSLRKKGGADFYSGKRRDQRFSDVVPLETTLTPNNPAARKNAYLHNISESGIAWWCKDRISERSTVYIRWLTDDGPGPWLATRVTHCTVGIRGFLVGSAFVLENLPAPQKMNQPVA